MALTYRLTLQFFRSPFPQRGSDWMLLFGREECGVELGGNSSLWVRYPPTTPHPTAILLITQSIRAALTQ